MDEYAVVGCNNRPLCNNKVLVHICDAELLLSDTCPICMNLPIIKQGIIPEIGNIITCVCGNYFRATENNLTTLPHKCNNCILKCAYCGCKNDNVQYVWDIQCGMKRNICDDCIEN